MKAKSSTREYLEQTEMWGLLGSVEEELARRRMKQGMRFKAASQAERTAAFIVVQKHVLDAIDKWVPFWWRSKARTELGKHQDEVLATIDDALAAAEAARKN